LPSGCGRIFLQNGRRRAKALQGDLKEALGVYGEAESLYGGDFLAEELYSPWVTAKREEIHRKYLDILSKMAHLYEKQGKFKKAIVYNKKLIQADPSLRQPTGVS
jgi:two-component SAPR family response regulator